MENHSILLTSKMLHDIHNKLTTILGYSEILQDEDSLSEEQRKMIESIASAALNIKSLFAVNKEETLALKSKEQNPQEKEIKILIVDDNEDNRIVLELILKKFPLTIFVAQTGLEAVKVANEQKPNLIFMDLNLPDITGLEASKIIKSDLQDIKIIALTGDLCMIERELKNSDLFELCLAKPFERNQIKNIISELMNETAQEVHLPKEYLLEVIACAKMGRISCLEDLMTRCHDQGSKKFLQEKILTFDFDVIIAWANKMSDKHANC
ncbi:MAG: response regulator [Thiovulaceae bacterium]|nr:response regulator [Sulfurimonadaceae bacterium]